MFFDFSFYGVSLAGAEPSASFGMFDCSECLFLCDSSPMVFARASELLAVFSRFAFFVAAASLSVWTGGVGVHSEFRFVVVLFGSGVSVAFTYTSNLPLDAHCDWQTLCDTHRSDQNERNRQEAASSQRFALVSVSGRKL